MGRISALLDELGIDYYINDDEAVAQCPSHDDKHPSWSVNLDSGLHHCFSCGFGGSLDTLVMTVLGLSYPEATSWIRGRAGLSLAKQWLEPEKVAPSSELRLTDADLALFTPPPPLALESRKITAEGAKKYEVLWNPDKCEWGTWIFPIRDPESYRLWGWQEKNERRFRNYPSGCRKSETLFGIRATEHDSTVILVESPVDAVRCFTSTGRTGVSSYGVHVSDQQLSLIHSRSERLILALDNDSAGVGETARICREFKRLPVYVFDWAVNEGAKDFGDMKDEEIKEGISNAIPAYMMKW
jgi:DNA primase